VALSGGRIWLERHAGLGETHGLAVADRHGVLHMPLCRRYPWQWSACSHAQTRLQQSLEQLAFAAPCTPPLQLDGPVLAVADLSAELHYHGHLELLPRLGRAWQQLQPQLPGLRLWHNAGAHRWLQQALVRLGVPAAAVIDGRRHPHLQASQLLVPSHPCPFGEPGPTSLAWLRNLWRTPVTKPANSTSLLLSRSPSQRRPLLQHDAWHRQLLNQGFHAPSPSATPAELLPSLEHCDRLVAAHGGAMANLLLLPPGSEVLELANPAYAPPYFTSLIRSGRLLHRRLSGDATPAVLQQLLYAGPLEWPIDLPPP